MKSMVWVPTPEKDRKANQYLDQMNHAPYELIMAIAAISVVFVTFTVLVGSF